MPDELDTFVHSIFAGNENITQAPEHSESVVGGVSALESAAQPVETPEVEGIDYTAAGPIFSEYLANVAIDYVPFDPWFDPMYNLFQHQPSKNMMIFDEALWAPDLL